MDRTPRTLRKKEPNLARPLILFGVALFASLIVGLVLSRHEPETKTVSVRDVSRAKPAATARPAQAAPAAESAMTVVPAVTTPAAVESTVSENAAALEAATEAAVEIVSIPEGPVSYQEAESVFFEKDWPRAAAMFTRYTEDRPNNPWGHYMRGLSLRFAGDPAEAEVALEACLAIDPDHVKSLVNLARVQLDLDRPADAAETAASATALDEENVDAHRVRARALHSQGLGADALEAYETALALEPNDAWSLNNRALILIEEERFEEAVTPLQLACELDAEEPVFRNNLGIALERTEQYRDAESAYGEALAIDPAYDKAAVSLARVEGLGSTESESVLAVAEESAEIGPAPAADDEMVVVAGAPREIPEAIDGE